ncbi:hypothetical protein SETIT_7G271600v2 [Setaria italica]|uniref:Uncharacterized protein n=2 Tax=Setaria TaxID=4554 RepID=K3YDN1_SETIT|nr:hypothetical protein SETIT_7G271600v2 [Setaria italica]TKW07059.1 hypothetical protein SEVIR_7G282700v2 [Setaria viridis]
MEPELQATLVKVPGVFVLVQALSSTVFSRTKSLGLRPARSLSARRMVAMLSDLPLAGEPPPVAAFARTRSSSLSSPLLAADHLKED